MQHHPAANVVHTAQLGKLGKPDYLSALSRELASKTFVEGNALSSADLQLLPGALGAAAAAAPLDDNARLKVAHALRWLDQIHHNQSATSRTKYAEEGSFRFQHSSIPAFQHSSIPAFQHTSIPEFQNSSNPR